MAFGKNSNGELGVSNSKDVVSPVYPKIKQREIIAKWISSGSNHSAIVTQQGELFIAGSTLHGKIGIQGLNLMQITKFQQVNALAGFKVVQVACGDYHTMCLTEEGQVYAWGGTLHKKLAERQAGMGIEPQLVTALADKHISYIDCGDFHSLALDYEGRLFTWGGGGPSYNKGQCGHGKRVDSEHPQQVLLRKRVIQASAGGYHTLALCEGNELYGWGNSMHGECGHGEYNEQTVPKMVKMPKGDSQLQYQLDTLSEDGISHAASQDQLQTPEIIQISAGGHHSLIMTKGGSVYSFGYGSHGQLGLRSTKNFATPQLVRDLLSKPIRMIAAGWNHSLVLSERGDLYSCGYGNHGQLGLGLEQIDSKVGFTHVSTISSRNISQIFAGGNHSWVTLDPNLPVRDRYSPPSPLGQIQQSIIFPLQSTSPLSLSPRQMPKSTIDPLPQQHPISIEVTYQDGMQLTQRYVTFELPQGDKLSRQAVEDWLTAQQMVYHKLVEQPDQKKGETSINVCVIVDSMGDQRVARWIEENAQVEGLFSDRVVVEEEDMEQYPLERQLGEWTWVFMKYLKQQSLVRAPRFKEIRPRYLQRTFI